MAKVLCFLLLGSTAWAATSTLATSSSSTTGATSYASGSFTPTANDFIIVWVAVTGKTAMSGSPACTDSLGGKYAQYSIGLKASSADTAYVYAAQQLASGSAMTVTCTTTATNATGGSMFVWRVSGITRLGTLAIRQHVEVNNHASGTPAPAFPIAVLTGNPTIGFIFNATSPAGMSAPTNWTEPSSPSGDLGYSSPTTGVETVSRNSGFTGTTVTWGSSSASAYAAMIIELDTSAQDGDFSTVFPATEAPISQSSTWTNGGATGLDWQNINTTPGFAYGAGLTSGYTDPTAVKTGTWVQNQKACAVVNYPASIAGLNTGAYEEIELRLNSSISAHVNNGYELDLQASNSGTNYIVWVRWNGNLGDYTTITSVPGQSCTSQVAGPGLNAGDVVCAYNSSGVLHLTINGRQPNYNGSCAFDSTWDGANPVIATDSTYTAGSPGVGTYCGSCSSGDNTKLGWSSFVGYGVASSGVRKRVVVAR